MSSILKGTRVSKDAKSNVITPSGTKYGAITNFDGRYNLLNMKVGGPYSVTVSYVGYKSQI